MNEWKEGENEEMEGGGGGEERKEQLRSGLSPFPCPLHPPSPTQELPRGSYHCVLLCVVQGGELS